MCVLGYSNHPLSSILTRTWRRHQMETFSALLAICAGNSPVPVNSPHKGQWRGALMFSLIYARINGWVITGEAGDLRRHHAHYNVIVMRWWCFCCRWFCSCGRCYIMRLVVICLSFCESMNSFRDSKNSWGQHGVHLGPTGPRWAPCGPHELCYLGLFSLLFCAIDSII